MEVEEMQREPMITMTVRQRDAMLYRIRELEGQVIALKARIAGLKLVAEVRHTEDEV